MKPFVKSLGARLGAAVLAAGLTLFGTVQAAEDGLALGGYDPVAYFTDSRATVGDVRYQFAWDGAVYRFASARHLELFKLDPDRYLPQFGSLCTISLAMGHKVAGDPRYWLVKDAQLYLFSAPSSRDQMTLDPAQVSSAAQRNWIQMSRPSALRR